MSINGQCRADTSQPHVSLLVNFLAKETVGVTGRLEVDALQYILRETPGSLNTSPSNWLDGLSSGVDAFNEILNLEAEADVEEPKYDFPIPNAAIEKQSEEALSIIAPDSIDIQTSERTETIMIIIERKQIVSGSAIRSHRVLPKHTIGGILKGDPSKKILQFKSIPL